MYFFQFNLIQVMGPFVHTLSQNKKSAVSFPVLYHFKPNKGFYNLKKPDLIGRNRYQFCT